MTHFTIDSDNNITAHTAAPTAAQGVETFTTAKELAALTANWPAARLVELWNSFAGVAPFDDLKPVKKFTDRKKAVARLWKAAERLAPDVAPQAPTVASKGRRAGKAAAKAKTPSRGEKKPAAPREGSKQTAVIDLMRRKNGATLAEVMKTTGWQPHTVRGFVSGALTKKLGLSVESFRAESGERTYRIAK